MIKVSIIIPIYNVEKYLRECLDSVINQTLSEIEIICVNDGSKDNCLEIIQEYAKVDSRIKILNKDNSGYGDSMNKGIELATGEYLGIVEPDDYVEKDMFQKLYSKAKEYDADIVKSNFFILQDSDKDKKITLVMLDESKKYYDKLLTPIKNLNVYRFPMYTWSGIYKREFINKNNIKHNTTPGASFQDNGFFFQTFSLAKTVYFINEAFYYYRWDNPNASGNQSRRNNLIKSKKEYDFIRTFVDKHSELNPNILYAYNWQKFHMYSSWIDDTSVDLFVQMAHQEFKAAYRNKEINYNLYSREQKRMLKTIIEHPYRYNDIWNKQDSNKFYQNIFSIKNEGAHKVIMLLGMKFKFKNKYKELKSEIANLRVQNLKQIEDLKMNIDCNASQLDRFRIDYAKKFQDMLTQILLEDNLKSYEDINMQSCIDKFKSVAVSYWDNDKNGVRFFNNFSFLFDKGTNISIINSYEKQNVYADVYFCWGTRSYLGQLINVYNSKLYKKKIGIVEDGFLRSIITNACAKELTKYHRGISFTFDCKSVYYDARQASTLELLLNDSSLIISDDQKQRARACIDRIVETHLSKYNHQPIFEPHIGREGVKKVLVVDQTYGDMSIARGLADNNTFEKMLECAIRENPDADIIVKTHPDTIAGDKGYYTAIKQHDNIYAQTEPINPISLIKYCDKVYVCTTQLGFEALMCGKEVHVFGMPFYAGWGLTHDRQKCERRTNTRTLEEVFYIAYIMYSYYVNPDKKCRCEIEEAMDYLLKLRDEYFREYDIRKD